MPSPAQESVLPFGQAAARLYAWPIENMLNLQTMMFSALQSSTKDWMGRRQEAASATAEAFERLLNCRSLEQAVSIQQEWFEGSLRRFDADWRAMADQTKMMTRETAAKSEEASSRSSEATAVAARGVERVGRSATRAGQETAETAKLATQEGQSAVASAAAPSKQQ